MPIIRLGKVLQITNTIEGRLNRTEIEEMMDQLQIRLYGEIEHHFHHAKHRYRGEEDK